MDNAATLGITDAFVHLYGFLFVLIVLSALWLIIEAIGVQFRRLDLKKSAAAASQTDPAKASASAAQNDVPGDEALVAIAAAVTIMLGTQHRVISIHNADTRWGREGRRQHVQSHTLPTVHKAVMQNSRRVAVN